MNSTPPPKKKEKDMAVGQSPFGIPFWLNDFRAYFSGDWDVRWGCDSDFDP